MCTKTKLFEFVIKDCIEEYKDKISTFNQLDTKAQQIAAFSGVLLGILISFCKKEVLVFMSLISIWCIVFCIISIVLLLIGICISIYSIRIIKIIGMPTFSEMKSEYVDILAISEDDLNEEHYQNYISRKIFSWEDTFKSISLANEKKAKFVFISQIICGTGLVFIGLVGIIILQSYLNFCSC